MITTNESIKNCKYFGCSGCYFNGYFGCACPSTCDASDLISEFMDLQNGIEFREQEIAENKLAQKEIDDKIMAMY